MNAEPTSAGNRLLRKRVDSLPASVLFAMLAVELLLISAANLPLSMYFDYFAFCDYGANLTIQDLISRGFRPTIDFGYNYGLLPLLLSRGWFALAGRTPWAYQGLMAVCDVLMAWALGRIFSRLKIGAIALAFLTLTAGYAVLPTYPQFAQALEAVLLCFAMAEQAEGRLECALCFSGAAIFAKPSMGYLYSLLIALLLARELSRRRLGARGWISAFAPAASVCFAMAAILAVFYGPAELSRTLFPVDGIANYRASNYGFFIGSGRLFWRPPDAGWQYYAFDVPGFWISSSVVLVAVALGAALRREWQRMGPDSTRTREILLTCALFHLTFVGLFFGNQWSWFYYSYFLVIGAVIAIELSPMPRTIGAILCAFALFSWGASVTWIDRSWRNTQRSTVTAGLWASPQERAEWAQVLELSKGHRAAILCRKGAAELMYPAFEQAQSLNLEAGLTQPRKIARKLEQLSRADIVVVPIGTEERCHQLPDSPELLSAVAKLGPLWRGKLFAVYRR